MQIKYQETKNLRNIVVMTALALPVLFFQAFSPSDAIDSDDQALSDMISGSKAFQVKVIEKDANIQNLAVATQRLETHLAYDLDAAERNSTRELTMIASILEGKDKVNGLSGEELRISQLEIK